MSTTEEIRLPSVHGETSLAEIQPGETVRVLRLHGAIKSQKRLMAMGLIGGKNITLETKAPLGDPKVYTILGYRLTIRDDDARNIRVVRS